MQANALPGPRGSTPRAKPPELSPHELILIMLKEGRKRILALSGTFTAIALLTLLIGMFVIPRNYSSSVTILAQDSDIIQPLLEGRAVTTGVADRAGMARQIIYGRKVLGEIVEIGGWTEEGPSPVEQGGLMEQIRNRTLITSPRPELVEIIYRDRDPERTFRVTEALGQLFIRETLATKERESREAYEFIDKQVREYHRKLIDAENNLQDYRSRNPDAQPGSAVDVNARISSLRTQVEQARMALMEQESREGSISSQLSGESAVTAMRTRETFYRTQLIELHRTDEARQVFEDALGMAEQRQDAELIQLELS